MRPKKVDDCVALRIAHAYPGAARYAECHGIFPFDVDRNLAGDLSGEVFGLDRRPDHLGENVEGIS